MLAVFMENRYKLKAQFEINFKGIRRARSYLVTEEGEPVLDAGEWTDIMTSPGTLDPTMFTTFFESYGWPVQVSQCNWQNSS